MKPPIRKRMSFKVAFGLYILVAVFVDAVFDITAFRAMLAGEWRLWDMLALAGYYSVSALFGAVGALVEDFMWDHDEKNNEG
jgi:hypothetical protein